MSYRWTIPHLRGFQPFSVFSGAACGVDFLGERFKPPISADRSQSAGLQRSPYMSAHPGNSPVSTARFYLGFEKPQRLPEAWPPLRLFALVLVIVVLGFVFVDREQCDSVGRQRFRAIRGVLGCLSAVHHLSQRLAQPHVSDVGVKALVPVLLHTIGRQSNGRFEQTHVLLLGDCFAESPRRND